MENVMSPEAAGVSQNVSNEQLKTLLAQARQTKTLLEDFKAAIESSTYGGHTAIRLATGLLFLDRMLAQNKADIQKLQEESK